MTVKEETAHSLGCAAPSCLTNLVRSRLIRRFSSRFRLLPWRLSLLHLHLLLLVPLLQFLGLFLMALFYLLSCLVVPLLRQPLILFLLLLRYLIPFFLLLRIKLFLLLLIFFVLPGITAARRRWPLVGRKFSNMAVGGRSTRRPRIVLWQCIIRSSACCVFPRLIASTAPVRRRIISSTRRLGLHHTTVSVCSRLRCGSDLRLAFVH